MWQNSKIRIYFIVFFLLFYPKILFSNIDGDEDTIMGLPIRKIKEYLEKYV